MNTTHQTTQPSADEVEYPFPELRHVLAIAYVYPPFVGSGTNRIKNFVRYLPSSGYRPVVLTTNSRGTLPDDADNFIVRADDIIGTARRLYQKMVGTSAQQEITSHASSAPNSGYAPSPDTFIQRMRTLVSIPEQRIVWYPQAVGAARQLVRRYPFRLLFSTSPPETNHLVALALKKQTGLPWVADFRDGWMFEPLVPQRRLPPRRAIEARMERAVVVNADAIVTTGDVLADYFKQCYPEQAHKLTVISNGYDEMCFPAMLPAYTPGATFRLVHTGNLALTRWDTSIEGLLHALYAMRTSGLSLMDHLQVVMVGQLTAQEQLLITDSGVGDHFDFVGPQPYHEAINYQLGADVLLNITSSQCSAATSNKLYEYLATGRPILVLGALDSVIGRTVAAMGQGLVVAPDDSAGIQRAIRTLHAQWQAGLLPTRRHPATAQFERRELTRKLARLFDGMLKEAC